MPLVERYLNTGYRNYFFSYTYWLRALKDPNKALRNLSAVIRRPTLYRVNRSVEGLISFSTGVLLYETVLRTKSNSLNIVEVGAFKGLSTTYLSLAASRVGKRLKSFELFSGLPTGDTELDPSFTKDDFSSDVNEYEDNVRRYGCRDVVDLIIGDARHSLQKELGDSGFCVAFLDVDTYEVTKDLLFILWPLAKGGETIIVHDVWSPGVRKSIDEFHNLSLHTVAETQAEPETACLVIPCKKA